MTKVHQIVDRDGNVIFTGKPDQKLAIDFMRRNPRTTGWGDHWRPIERRRDPENVVMKCTKSGEKLLLVDVE